MKKIILIYDFLKELGGLERVMFFYANCLKKEYNPQLFFSFVSEKEKKEIVRELELDRGIQISRIWNIRNDIISFAMSLLFPNRINKIDSDLIISYSFMASRMAFKKKIKQGMKYIILMCHPPNFLYSNIRGWANDAPRFFAKLLGVFLGDYLKRKDKQYVKNADLVISISKYTQKRIKDIYGIDSEIVYPQISGFFKVIENSKIKKFMQKKDIKEPFIYAHGRIIPDKNYKILLDIAKDLDINIIISGSISENYRKELEDYATKIGNKKVKVLGRISREDLLGYYNSASLFLIPAYKEDFGLTMVEAIACGCPVVAWDDNAGPSEVVNRENGMLAKPYLYEDFLSKIKDCINRKWDKKKVSSTSHKFSANNIEKQFKKIIDNFIKKGLKNELKNN